MIPTGNILTLWEKALPAELIPDYPSYRLAVAKGGETTHEIDREASVLLKNPFNSLVVVRSREAEAGELLRDSVLKYVADWGENMTFRGQVIETAEKNPEFQELQGAFAKSSILYFANVFCWTFDDRLISDRIIPFVTYLFQDDILTWTLWLVLSGQSGIEEKSRDMGASWMEALVVVYLAIFYQRMNSKMMSMREDDVDDRTTDSLIGKVRFILNNLPPWLRGGWVERGTGMDVNMAVTVPGTDSVVKGILSKGTAGRSGRTAYNSNDEWAFVEDSTEALRSLSELSNSKKFLSSANGAGNEMFRMREDPSSLLKTLHWSLHPLKNAEWALARKGRSDVTEEIWAAEQEISYETSTMGRVFPQFVSLQSEETPWCHIPDSELVLYESVYDVWTVTDLGVGDPCSTLFVQIKPTPTELNAFCKETVVFFDEHEARDMTAMDLRYYLNSKGYNYRGHICDWRSGGQRDPMGNTWISYLAEPDAKPTNSKFFGGTIIPGPPIQMLGQRSDEHSTLVTFREKLGEGAAVAVSKHGCPGFIKALQNWSFPIDLKTRLPLTDSGPKHDQWSHSCKSALYFFDWHFGKKRTGKGGSGDWNYPATKLNMR